VGISYEPNNCDTASFVGMTVSGLNL
jgi:hypothetical protein